MFPYALPWRQTEGLEMNCFLNNINNGGRGPFPFPARGCVNPGFEVPTIFFSV
jgi:hypothetical protein